MPLPTIFDEAWLQERIFPEVGRLLAFHMGDKLVAEHCSPDGSTSLFTVIHRPSSIRAAQGSGLPIIDTTALVGRCFKRFAPTSTVS